MAYTTPIENVVVLMMENHSFDNMLGWVKGIGELTGTEKNISSRTGRVHTTGEYRSPSFVTNPCPAHDFTDVTKQVFGESGSDCPNMSGFVDDYEAIGGHASGVMGCYSPEQLPVITKLARTFTVCTRWFSSVPGPTGPNRIFASCASSGGYAGGAYEPNPGPPPGDKCCADGNCAQKDFLPSELASLKSIFGVMGTNGYTWGTFHEQTSFATESVLNEVTSNPVNGRAYWDPGFETFQAKIVKKTLPNYSFLTPGLLPNSQHSPSDVRYGECVMANIYELLANSDYWEKTLFVITYDEHGGFYDSRETPITGVVNPGTQDWDQTAPPDYCFECNGTTNFKFDRLGVRVPALLISPYVAAGVDCAQYEHSSIVATVLKLFDLTWPETNYRLNAGHYRVNTFEAAIGGTLRSDLPKSLLRPPADYTPLPRPVLRS